MRFLACLREASRATADAPRQGSALGMLVQKQMQKDVCWDEMMQIQMQTQMQHDGNMLSNRCEKCPSGRNAAVRLRLRVANHSSLKCYIIS